MRNSPAVQHNQKSSPAIEDKRRLPKKWWIVLIALGFLAWASVGAMAFVPLWLWAGIVATLICVVAAIALFAPRRTPR